MTMTAGVSPYYLVDAASGGFILGLLYTAIISHFVGPARDRRRRNQCQ